jgi:tRNA U54 and U55 pseudouridine synthase Pus10
MSAGRSNDLFWDFSEPPKICPCLKGVHMIPSIVKANYDEKKRTRKEHEARGVHDFQAKKEPSNKAALQKEAFNKAASLSKEIGDFPTRKEAGAALQKEAGATLQKESPAISVSANLQTFTLFVCVIGIYVSGMNLGGTYAMC